MLKHTVKEINLKNGAKGLLIDVPDASVMCAMINFRAGDHYVSDPQKWETAHIMEHMSLGANKKYPKSKQLTAEIEKNGAYTNAQTALADMTYTMECADFEWQRVLELMCVGISQPLFLEEEFKSEYGNVHEEMLYRGNNHGWHLSIEMEKLFGLNVRTFQDRLALMPNVTVEDVRDHYVRTHYAQNMRFVIAGKMKGRIRAITQMLNTMPLPKQKNGSRLKLIGGSPQPLASPVFIPNDTVPNTYFYLFLQHPQDISRDESLALSILNAILTDTWSSRVFGVAREKGLAYYINSGIDRETNYATWWFGTQVSEKQIKPLVALLVDELARLRDGKLNKRDLASAKMYIIGSHQRSAQTVGSIAGGYSGRYFSEDKINDFFSHLPARVERVTEKDIVDAARKMLSAQNWGIGFLGTVSEKARSDAHAQLAKLWE